MPRTAARAPNDLRPLPASHLKLVVEVPIRIQGDWRRLARLIRQ
jgi:hypothetical protein